MNKTTSDWTFKSQDDDYKDCAVNWDNLEKYLKLHPEARFGFKLQQQSQANEAACKPNGKPKKKQRKRAATAKTQPVSSSLGAK